MIMTRHVLQTIIVLLCLAGGFVVENVGWDCIAQIGVDSTDACSDRKYSVDPIGE